MHSTHSTRSLVVAAVLLLASSIPTRAQNRGPGGGWGLLGLGVGVANITCAGDGCSRGWNLNGPTLLATAGVMLTPHVGVGLGLDQWWRNPADSEATNTGTLLLHYYPSVRSHAFVEVGAGLSRAEVRLDGGRHADGRALALMAGAGYDLPLIRVRGANPDLITLTPRVSYVYSSIGELRYADGSPFATGWRHQVLSAGFAAGFKFPE